MQGRRGVIVAGAAAVIVALLLVFFLVLPKMGQVSDAQQDLQATQDEQEALQVQLAALENAREQAPENEAVIRQVNQMVPPTADLPGLILFLRNSATVAGVQVLSLTPGAPTLSETNDYSSISVSASGEGSY